MAAAPAIDENVGQVVPAGSVNRLWGCRATKGLRVLRRLALFGGYAAGRARTMVSHRARSVPALAHRIAVGLMIICTAPLIRDVPSTNMNSHASSATISRLSMFSRM